jgi:hypothetical protein
VPAGHIEHVVKFAVAENVPALHCTQVMLSVVPAQVPFTWLPAAHDVQATQLLPTK